MIAASSLSRTAWQPASRAASLIRLLAPAALLAAIGVELAVLAAWLPDTIDRALHGPAGDYGNLYWRARDLELMNLYNPGLTLLLHPLSYLGELNGYRVISALNAVSVLAIAWIAQRGLPSLEARLAVALGIISLPQTHWAIRLGHLTPMLALVALSGFLLMRTSPRRAALVFSLLSIKPQYAAAPFLYLAWRRQYRALALMAGAAAALAFAGFAVIGPAAIGEYLSQFGDWGSNSADDLLPVQQAWLYSWPGVQTSLGIEPNALLTFDLMLLSAGVVALAWARTDPAKGVVVAAFAMLLLTPYSQFYDAALVGVGLALLMRSGLRPLVSGGIAAALYAACVVSQANTNFPVKDALGPASTDGVYWVMPALLAAAALIALLGGKRRRDAMEIADGH